MPGSKLVPEPEPFMPKPELPVVVVEVGVQRPIEQVLPAMHTLPHAPQLLRSVASEVSHPSVPTMPRSRLQSPLRPLQKKLHEPEMHAPTAFVGLPQLRPQAPQFVGSTEVLTQTPPQSCVGDAQLSTHMPDEQICPAPQPTPQPPQFARSFCVLTHEPAQFWVGDAQLS